MDAIINGIDDEAVPLAFSALNAIAAELPLEVILLELRDFYRKAQDDAFTRTCPDYQQICDSALRALDTALWRLETEEGK